jgi:hypothetical protein
MKGINQKNQSGRGNQENRKALPIQLKRNPRMLKQKSPGLRKFTNKKAQ